MNTTSAISRFPLELFSKILEEIIDIEDGGSLYSAWIDYIANGEVWQGESSCFLCFVFGSWSFFLFLSLLSDSSFDSMILSFANLYILGMLR